jgi:hypothetical protein
MQTKRQSVEWHHLLSPQEKKFKNSASVGKVMIVVFCDREYDADRRDDQLLHFWQDVERIQEAFQMSLASQESSRNVASAWQGKATQKFEDSESHKKFTGTVLPHPPYSPNPAPSDHLLQALKDAMCNMKFQTNVNVICAVGAWPCEQNKVWYQQCIQILILDWCKAVEAEGNAAESQSMQSDNQSSLCIIFMFRNKQELTVISTPHSVLAPHANYCYTSF